MLKLFSSDTRYQTWRRLWVSLAKAQYRLGLPITAEQISEMEAHIKDIDYDCVRQREKEADQQVPQRKNQQRRKLLAKEADL